jgi:hypothetical protein
MFDHSWHTSFGHVPLRLGLSCRAEEFTRAVNRIIHVSEVLMHRVTLFAGASALLAAAVSFAQTDAPPTPASNLAFHSWAPTPPMGWNSWDSFGSSIKEADLLANVEYLDKRLKSHGWNLITVDIQWYEPNAQRDQYHAGAPLEMDANGRLLPAPNRFPMTAETHTWKPFADYLHAKGLKFGLHLMRGIPRQAVDRDNVLIMGTEQLKDGGIHAADIVNKQNSCRWNRDMYGVDMSKPGAQEYYDSVFKLYASWGLDFVKVDDLAGQKPEIEGIRKALDKCGRSIVLSISMGSGANQGPHLVNNANMWRVSFDFWDNWPALYQQFGNLNAHQPFQGPGHWPDADMIPFGNLKTWNPNQFTKFTHDEQYTVMTLWSIARSPLILGANLPNNDEFTQSLLTNDEILAVDQHSTNNHQVFNRNDQVVWEADVEGSSDKYVALFNISPPPPPGGRGRGRGGRGGPGAPATATAPAPASLPAAPSAASTQPATISVSLAELGLTGPVKVRDLWAQKDLGKMNDAIQATVNSHGTAIFRVSLTQ